MITLQQAKQAIIVGHRDESGLFSLSHIAASIFLTIALLCLINVNVAVTDRASQQRQAEAAAESLGAWKARNLNAVVAQQHLMGELMALVITHHAIGGDLLDQDKAADTAQLDRRLTIAHVGAIACKTGTPAFDDVSSEVHAGEALLKAHKQLKKLLTTIYIVKTAAYLMQLYPPTRPAGEALEEAAHVVELAIHQEWKTLESIRGVAVDTKPTKLLMLNHWLPDAKRQLDKIVQEYPVTQQQLVDELAGQYELEIAVLKSDQRLPLIEDPLARLFQPPADWQRPVDCDCPSVPADNMRHQLAKVTQLARATFPWVNYHRHPLIDKMKPLTPLSGMADHYFDATAGVSKRMMDEKQREGQLAFYVFDDYQGPDKAYEDWMKREGSGAADKTFGLTVVVGRERREPIGSFLFHPQSGSKSYRIASSLVWNRQAAVQPSQRIDLYCKRIVPSVQAHTGWDTLNWHTDTTAYELVGFGIPSEFPAIETAWTSRLNPTSAARITQLRTQPLPSWAEEVRDVLPQSVSPELTGL